MSKWFLLLIVGTLNVITQESAFGQGCSDAGFCTIGNLGQHPRDTLSRHRQKITVMLPAGVGDEAVFVFAPGLQYDNQLSKQWVIQAKITANYASGNLGAIAGPGDMYFSGTYVFTPVKKWKISGTIGTKVPLNQSNLKIGSKSLPMQYQSSLGTIDLITGVSLVNNNWQFSAGWQQPLSGRNRNNFLPVYWNTTEAYKYSPSNDFDRKGDVLLRSAYLMQTNKRLSFNLGLLGIYHLAEDTYVDANTSSKPIAIKGSQGLTLNATIAGWWKINGKVNIGLTGGVPLIVREVRPDGLTRSFVLAPEVIFNF